MKSILSLLRPQQWIKNVFVFLPMFFGGRIADVECWLMATLAFMAMCFTASAIYCMNDILDRDDNRRHPRKRYRPVASGKISVRKAWAVFGVMLVLAGIVADFGFSGLERGEASVLLGGYLLLNIAYCLWLKRIAIVDVFCISAGFVIRVFLGGVSCGIWVSPWLVCLTFLLTLFLAFAKRRDDVILRLDTGTLSRASTAGYNVPFMNQVLGLLGAITMTCYIIYTVQPEVEARFGSEYIYLTSVFVLAGLLRYLQLTLVENVSDDPTEILQKDRFIKGCVACWLAVFVIILYF